MKFMLIPPGEFTMGSTPEEIAAALEDVFPNYTHWQDCIKSEAPQHKVILTQPIYMGMNEVTQAEYEKVMGVNPSDFATTGRTKVAVAGLETADFPVELVNWNNAAEFCAKLSGQEKLKPFYFHADGTVTPRDGTGYRLPSEAEWEFACRAGTATKYWIGDNVEDLMLSGWFGGNSGRRTHAAGELKANPFGLFDMHGNVSEWVQDGWDATGYTQFDQEPAVNPCAPFIGDSQRVVRGGNWNHAAIYCRSSGRLAAIPATRNSDFGFRVSLVVDAVRPSTLPNVSAPQSVSLFNGRDLTGWKTHPDAPGNWRVENGVLVSSGTPSYLFSERDDFGDFELTCEVSISQGGDGGIIVRTPFQAVGPNGLPGYEAQIQSGNVLVAGWSTGAISQSDTSTGWGLKSPAATAVTPDQFFPMKIAAIGNRIETWVDGVRVAEYVDEYRTYQRGHIALQHSGANTVVKFRNIAISELR